MTFLMVEKLAHENLLTATPFLASSEGDFKDTPFGASCARLTAPYKFITPYLNESKYANFGPRRDSN